MWPLKVLEFLEFCNQSVVGWWLCNTHRVAMYCDNIIKSDQIQEVANSRFKVLSEHCSPQRQYWVCGSHRRQRQPVECENSFIDLLLLMFSIFQTYLCSKEYEQHLHMGVGCVSQVDGHRHRNVTPCQQRISTRTQISCVWLILNGQLF